MKLLICLCLQLMLVLGQRDTSPVRTTRRPMVKTPSPFIFVTGRSIEPGSDKTVTLTTLKETATSVKVTLQLRMFVSRNNGIVVVTQSEYINARSMGTRVITLRVPETDRNPQRYELIISCDTVFCSSTSSLRVDRTKSRQIFIQTDKAIYKPEDDVKFRIIAVEPDLKPSSDTYSITIKDARDNIVRQWKGQTPNKGVLKNSLQLSEDPAQGRWRITATSENKDRPFERVKMFEVGEYVLPKFEVVPDIPPFHIIGENVYKMTLNAKYTHGGGVNSTAVVTVTPQSYGCRRPVVDSFRPISPPGPPSRSGPEIAFDIPPPGPNDCSIVRKYTQQAEDGKVEIELTNDDLINLIPLFRCDSTCISSNLKNLGFFVKAHFTEAFTNLNASATGYFRVVKEAANLKFHASNPDNYRVGIAYRGLAIVEKIDSSPWTASDLIDTSGRRRQIRINYSTCHRQCEQYGPSDNCVDNPARTFDLNADGLVPFTLPVFAEGLDFVRLKMTFTDKYGNEKDAVTTVRPFCQGTKETLSLSADVPAEGIRERTYLRFRVTTTMDVREVYYSVVAKNNAIVKSDQVLYARPTRDGEFQLYIDENLYRDMAPFAKIMAWAVSDNTFIADTVQVELEVKLRNDVSIQFHQNVTSPGAQVSFTVRASRNSYIGILGVDKSVQLLGTGNDINRQRVIQTMKGGGYGGGPYPVDSRQRSFGFGGPVAIRYCPFCGFRPVRGSNIPDLLSQTGVHVLTTATQCNLYAKQCPYPRWRGGGPQDGSFLPFPSPQAVPVGVPGAPGPPPATISPRDEVFDQEAPVPMPDNEGFAPVSGVRSFYPETWLWLDGESDYTGQEVFTVSVPDTITTWVASAFAIDNIDGLGVADPASMRTFQPFFVTATLPYSIVRGEEFLLNVNVFNYLEEEQPVVVTLKRSNDFTTLNNGFQSTQDVSRSIRIRAGQSKFVQFWVVPTSLGNIDINLRARSTRASDAITRKLLVKPEGTEMSWVFSKYIALSEFSSSSYSDSFNIPLPRNVVIGSEKMSISVTGSVMGQVTSNIGNYARLPSGCGEQNMINFVPNIVVMKYLTATATNNDVVKEKAMGYIRKGYQREMNYLRKDGSFSAFGNRDKYGSIWLTAYVMKSFGEANQFIGDEINEGSVAKSVRYIIQEQKSTGEFNEDQKSGNRFLKGGSGSGVASTAYYVIALTTVKNHMPLPQLKNQIDRALSLATSYLRREIANIRDPYTMAIVTYALALNNHRELFNKLDQLATTQNGETHWGGVEATGYAMLAKLTYSPSDSNAVLPSLKWLVKKFGKNSGFSSTQDTVVALAALARFAALTSSASGMDLTIRATANNNRDAHQFDRITNSNKEVFQIYRFTNIPRSVGVSGSRAGSAIIQLVLDYNILEPENTNDLDVIVNTDIDTIGKVSMKTCVRWNPNEDSGMAVVEITPLSGYEIVTNQLLERYKDEGLEKVEVKGKKLITYWDKLTRFDKCFNITQVKVAEIAKIKPAEVAAYSYYAVSSKRKVVMYNPIRANLVVDPCKACKDCCPQGPVVLATTAPININNNNNNVDYTNNLALRKNTYQSNTYGTLDESSSSHAVDGNNNSHYENGSCSHSGWLQGESSWWFVDLKRNTNVRRVSYVRRSDCCDLRNTDMVVAASNFKMQVGRAMDMTALAFDICGEMPGISPHSVTHNCNVYGQYVYVFSRKHTEFLSLCEVEVFGRQ